MRANNLERAKWVIGRDVFGKGPRRWTEEERQEAMWFIALSLLEQEEMERAAKGDG